LCHFLTKYLQIKDLQAARSKASFKTVADIDAHIKQVFFLTFTITLSDYFRLRNLEKQIESGSMKVVEEKRALQEIEQARRTRKIVERFQADDESIEADRRAADELRKQLDDPESKEISERYDAIKAELDGLKKEADEAYAGRSKLFEERDGLQAQINALFNEKRESTSRFREANDRYWTKVNEDRARRAERARKQRADEEAQKKLALAERLREEASLPAFQTEIEDCQTLIDALSGKPTGNIALSSSSVPAKPDVLGVPQLEIRQVEAVADTMVVRKKKGEDEESYFVGKAKKAKKGPKTSPTSPVDTDAINLPFGQLSALLSLSIPPPTGQSDISRVVEDLKTKKAWFEANQARQTAENIAKAEAEIQRLITGAKADGRRDAASHDISPPNGDSEQPPESTPADVPGIHVDEKLDDAED